LCNNYVTYIVAKHDSNFRYQVYGIVCSTEPHLFMHLLHTGLYTVAHNIDIVSHKQLIQHTCTPHCCPF